MLAFFTSVLLAQSSPTMFRALHMGGHWGENPNGIAEQPPEYYAYLRNLGVNWVGISIGLHVSNSLDSTGELVNNDPGGIPGFIPTFSDEEIAGAIRGFRRNNINVSLNLCFEIAEAAVAQYPVVRRTDLGDPFVPSRETSVKAENWPWDPGHPKYQSFTSSFWRTYIEQAVHFARIAQAEGAKMFVVGTENDRLFRTRSGPQFTNHFRSQIKAMVDSVRKVFSGYVSYELHWGALADTTTFAAGADHLWEDGGFDIVGVSAYFQLAPSTPTTVMSLSMLEANWEDAFTRMVIPLKNRNPNLPLLFLEFGYVDVVGSPYFADLDCFTTSAFRDDDGNGKDDGEETQANIHEAFFKVNERHNRLVQGVFLWGNDIASIARWQNSFGQQRTHAVRNKLAAQVVKDYYKLYTPIPLAPVIVAPASGAQNVAVSPMLVWQKGQDASTYSVQVSETSGFTTLKVDSTGIPDTSITIPNLQSQKNYYWRAASKNNAGTSSWSTTSSFTTTATAPSQPTLLLPAAGATGVLLQPTLSWTSSAGAVTYRLQVSTQPGFSPLVVDDSTLTATSKAIGPMVGNTKYYWRVNAKNSAGVSPWTTVITFTTINAAPLAPTLVSPTPDAAGVSLQLNLTWNASAGATSYRLQLSTQSGFVPLIVDDSTLTSTSRVVGPLTSGTKYFWRVSAKNDGGTSVWSISAAFTTAAMTLASPTLQSPAMGATGISQQPALSWLPSPGAVNYRLQLSSKSDFTQLAVDDSLIPGTSRSVGPLTAGTLYYWRVRAQAPPIVSAWSDVAMFTTQVASSVEWLSDVNITEFRLHPNYPNPFNPTTVILYQVPVACKVQIAIFNSIGVELGSLVERKQPRGLYRMQLRGKDLPSGVYFVRMRAWGSTGQTEEFQAVRRIVLIR